MKNSLVKLIHTQVKGCVIMSIKIKLSKYLLNLFICFFSVAIIVVVITGCVETDVETGKMTAVSDQLLEYDQVKERLDKLKQGMVMHEVLFLLGSPAKRSGNEWIYLPNRPSWVIPGEAIHIKFHRNVYVSHKFVPIVLGEEIDL